jgi:hypothetical protein
MDMNINGGPLEGGGNHQEMRGKGEGRAGNMIKVHYLHV